MIEIMNTEIIETKELVCIDADHNHECYYRLLLIYDPDKNCHMIVQQHARLGKRAVTPPKFCELKGIPIPEANPFFMEKRVAEEYLEKIILDKTRRKTKTYRFLKINEHLIRGEDGSFRLEFEKPLPQTLKNTS